MFYGEALVDELLQGGDADFEVVVHVGGIDFLVALGGFHALRKHRLIGNQQQRAGRDLIKEPRHEDRRRLHIDGEDVDFFEVFFKRVVVFPHAAVGRVNRAGPVIAGEIADRRRDGFLQREGRQRDAVGLSRSSAKRLAPVVWESLRDADQPETQPDLVVLEAKASTDNERADILARLELLTQL